MGFTQSKFDQCVSYNVVDCPQIQSNLLDPKCSILKNKYQNCYESQNDILECKQCQIYQKNIKNPEKINFIEQCQKCVFKCLEKVKNEDDTSKQNTIFYQFIKPALENCSTYGKIMNPKIEIQSKIQGAYNCIKLKDLDDCYKYQLTNPGFSQIEIENCTQNSNLLQKLIKNSKQCKYNIKYMETDKNYNEIVPYGYIMCFQANISLIQEQIEQSQKQDSYFFEYLIQKQQDCLTLDIPDTKEFTYYQFNECLLSFLIDCPIIRHYDDDSQETQYENLDEKCAQRRYEFDRCYFQNSYDNKYCQECKLYQQIDSKKQNYLIDCQKCADYCLGPLQEQGDNVFDDFGYHVIQQCADKGIIYQKKYDVDFSLTIYSSKQCIEDKKLQNCKGHIKDEEDMDTIELEKCEVLFELTQKIMENSLQCQRNINYMNDPINIDKQFPYGYLLCESAATITEPKVYSQWYSEIVQTRFLCNTIKVDHTYDFTIQDYENCLEKYLVECPKTEDKIYDKVCEERNQKYRDCYQNQPTLFNCRKCQEYYDQQYIQYCFQCAEQCLGKKEQGNVFDDYMYDVYLQCSSYGDIIEYDWEIDTKINQAKRCIKDNNLQNCEQNYKDKENLPEKIEKGIKKCQKLFDQTIEIQKFSKQCQRANHIYNSKEHQQETIPYEYLLCQAASYNFIPKQVLDGEGWMFKKLKKDRLQCNLDKYDVVLDTHSIYDWQQCQNKYLVDCPSIDDQEFDDICTINNNNFQDCFNGIKNTYQACKSCQSYLDLYKENSQNTFFLKDCDICTQQCLENIEKGQEKNIFELYIQDVLINCSARGKNDDFIIDGENYISTKESYDRCVQENHINKCQDIQVDLKEEQKQNDFEQCELNLQNQQKIIENSTQCTNAIEIYDRSKYDSRVQKEYLLCQLASRVDTQIKNSQSYEKMKNQQQQCMQIKYKPKIEDDFTYKKDIVPCIENNCSSCPEFDITCEHKKKLYDQCINSKKNRNCISCNRWKESKSPRFENCQKCLKDCKGASTRVSPFQQYVNNQIECYTQGKIPKQEMQKFVNIQEQDLLICLEQLCYFTEISTICTTPDYNIHEELEQEKCETSYNVFYKCIQNSQQCKNYKKNLKNKEKSQEYMYSQVICEQSCLNYDFNYKFLQRMECRHDCFKNQKFDDEFQKLEQQDDELQIQNRREQDL